MSRRALAFFLIAAFYPGLSSAQGVMEPAPPSGMGGASPSSRGEETEVEKPVIIPAQALELFKGANGEPLTWSELVDLASEADVVVLGEMHGQTTTQAAMALLFEEVVKARPGAALSLEFLERDQQIYVDDFLAGLIDEQGFKERTGRTETSYPEGHRQMVLTAKGAGCPVIAANAPRRYARLARTAGFDALRKLTSEERRTFVIPSVEIRGDYLERFRATMAEGHGPGMSREPSGPNVEDPIEGFFRSQSLWDATMADSIARAVREGRGPVVHVVGQFHSDFDGGLTQRLERSMKRRKVLVVSFASGTGEQGLETEDRGRADVVVYVGE